LALKRSLRLFEFICLGINCVIGTGVFLNPASVQKMLGPSGILAYALCGLLCMLIGLCFCEMGSTYEGTGGACLYARETLGPFAGYLVGWQIWLSSIIGWASVAKGFYIYWKELFPSTWAGSEFLTLFLLIAVLSFLNYLGVKQGSRANNFFALTKLLPLFLFMIVGVFFIKAHNFTPFFQGTPVAWGPAIICILYAYTGFEDIGLPAGEGVDSRRDLPRALFLVLAGTTLAYIVIQIVAVGVLPSLASSERPLVDAARVFMGPAGAFLLVLGGLLSIGGINSSIALTGPRALYALAEGNSLLSWLTNLHPSYRTPYRAILVNSLLTLILACTGTFALLLNLSVLAALWQYVPTCLAVIVARQKKERKPPLFIIPGGLTVPLSALALTLVLVSQVGWLSLGWSLVGTVLGLPLYLFSIKKREQGLPE
jgi:basic amino acid/polyamine antiporter, APA family